MHGDPGLDTSVVAKHDSALPHLKPTARLLSESPAVCAAVVPAKDTGTAPYSMRDRKAACYEHGTCDRDGELPVGSGSLLFYIFLSTPGP